MPSDDSAAMAARGRERTRDGGDSPLQRDGRYGPLQRDVVYGHLVGTLGRALRESRRAVGPSLPDGAAAQLMHKALRFHLAALEEELYRLGLPVLPTGDLK